GELDADLNSVVDDVGIGQDNAVRADDEAGTHTAYRSAILRLGKLELERQIAQERREVLVVGALAVAGGLPGLDDADVNHSRPVLLDQAAEIGQCRDRSRRSRRLR